MAEFIGASRLSDLPLLQTPIQIPPVVHPVRGRAKPQPPIDEVTIAAVPPVGTTLLPPPFTVLSGFQGLSFSSTNAAPPDVSIAVGPIHIVETINTIMAVYDKSGTLVMGPVSLDTFFNTGAFSTFDPKVMFDAESGRFFIVLVGLDEQNDLGKAWVAASQTSDPTGAWNKYVLVERTGSFPDYPGFGYCSDKVIVSANAFTVQSPTFQGTEFWVISMADLISGAVTLNTVYFAQSNLYFTIQPAESQEPTTDMFMVAVDTFSFDAIHFFHVTGEPGVSPVNLVRTVLATNSGSFPPAARQPGLRTIDSLDDRFQRAVWRSNSLWATATGACLPPGDVLQRSCPRLMEISTVGGLPTILQDFAYGLATFDFYFAAPQTDANGNLVVVFSRSSPTEFAGVQFAGRLVTDAANTASAPVLLKAGERTYDCTFCPGDNRWGDYFHAVVDPVDGSLWVGGEYAGSPTSNDYATWIAHLTSPPGTTTSTTTTSTTTTSTTTTSTTTTSTTTTSTTTTSTTTTSTTTTSTTTTSTTTTSTTTTPPPRGAWWPNCTWDVELPS